jgi:hypothetical protein
MTTSQVQVLPYRHISGFVLSNHATNDDCFTVSAGQCRDISNATNIILNSSITKDLSSDWEEGSGEDYGCNVSAATIYKATEWIHIYVIACATKVDVFASMLTEDTIEDNLPSGNYQYARRIGSLAVGDTGTNKYIIDFVQKGDEFYWNPPIHEDGDLDYPTNGSSGNLTVREESTFNLTYVPDSVEVKANLYAYSFWVEANDISPPSLTLYPTWLDLSSFNAIETNAPYWAHWMRKNPNYTSDITGANGYSPMIAEEHTAGGHTYGRMSHVYVWIDESRQFKCLASGYANTTHDLQLCVITAGWIDPRGKDGQ